MYSRLVCFNADCRATYSPKEVIYSCRRCGGLLEASIDFYRSNAPGWKDLWRQRRLSNQPLDTSGVWRYREMLDFFRGSFDHVVTLREGNTPLLDAPRAASYAGLDALTFKHQGFNPTGSFKDNGMTCGVSQARKLGLNRVACVSTGNTSASLAAYAAAAGLEAIILIPNGNIAFGKLSQALDYGAKTLQVDANFDQILALVRVLAEKLGIYLLNSINPYRIEGQKSIVIEMLDQLDWVVPDWIVLPGGNLGNTSAMGKALRELHQLGLIHRLPRIAVVQATGSAPFYDYVRQPDRTHFPSIEKPETLATAIKIGDPMSYSKALREIECSHGHVDRASEQEIADAKAVIGACGIGCEPASAATLAGIKHLHEQEIIGSSDHVVAILTGNALKDPDYVYRYHTGQLDDPHGARLTSRFANKPVVVPNDADAIASLLS